MLETLKKLTVRILGVIFAVVFLFFSMVNQEVLTLEMTPFPYVIEIRLYLLIAILLLAGILLGWFVASFESRRRYLVQKESRKRLAALENEVTALRARHQLSLTSSSGAGATENLS